MPLSVFLLKREIEETAVYSHFSLNMISRNNNFDLIRLFAALQVVIGHTVSHLELNIPWIKYIKFGALPGVLIFFVISGFLITASYDRNRNNIKQYLKNRFLRIFPALWISTIVLSGVMMFYQIIDKSDLLSKGFLSWFVGQTTLFQFYTPDLLRSFGVHCPNGSLWTIPVEFSFYILLPLMFVLFKKSYKYIYLFIVCSVGYNMFVPVVFGSETIFSKLLSISVFTYLYNFLIGAVLFFHWDRLRKYIEGKFFYWLAIYIIVYVLGCSPAYHIHSVTNLIANLMLAPVVLSAAYTKPNLGGLLKGYDISYGVYIYHMVVVNIFVEQGWLGESIYLLHVFVLSILLGLFSWIFVERKALMLKNKRFF